MAYYDIYQLKQDWKNVKGVFGEFKNKIDLKLSEIESFERNKDALLKESYDKGCDEQLEKDSGTIEQLTQDKENAYDEGYRVGTAIAWNIAARLEILTSGELQEVFPYDDDTIFICNRHPLEFVKNALDKWDNKCNDTVVVGDEVTTGFGKFVVTTVSDDSCCGISEYGASCSADKSLCKKTGRHFKELDDLFLAMGKPAEAD